jgi:hypothetical protein
MTALHAWLAWQFLIMSLLFVGAFIALRVQVEMRRLKRDVVFIKELLLVFLSVLGQDNTAIKNAVENFVDGKKKIA